MFHFLFWAACASGAIAQNFVLDLPGRSDYVKLPQKPLKDPHGELFQEPG